MSDRNPAAILESIRSMARVSRAWSPSFSPDGQQLAFVSDMSGRPQLWQIDLAGGAPAALSAFDEQVNAVSWSPTGDWLAVEVAPGGGMNAQIELLRPADGERRRLTRGQASNNWLNGWAKDGTTLLFSSNMDEANAMHCYRYRLGSGAIDILARNPGTGLVEDIAADGRQALLKRIVYRGDSNIYLLDLANGAEILLTPHQPPASFANARFSRDGRHVYLISNRDSDMAGFYRLALAEAGEWQKLQARPDAELVEFAINGGEDLAALVWNRAGRQELELLDLRKNRPLAAIDLPGEIVDSVSFSADGAWLALCLTGSRRPQDIWLLDTSSYALRQLTHSPHAGVDLEALVAPTLLRYAAHDGLPLSGWLYLPKVGAAPYPLVLSFHGGPEGQEQPRFRYDYQALLAQGIAVFAPNVRGSGGFGKRFVNLDNGALRVNAIQDIASTARCLLERGLAGPLGIMGGSYGGYMTMAGLTEFPELFAAGVNLYGLVNFKTFFAHTEPWMASISKIEYGDPETEGPMLDALSPIHKLEAVRAPTLVLHGANDTNVPVYEAEQVVEKLRARGVPVEYILFPDEGHGFREEKNRIHAASAIVNWFSKYLLR